MTEMNLEQALQEADLELKQVEIEFGPDDPRLADCLEAYGMFLKDKKIRLLDAANMLARASIIREKLSNKNNGERHEVNRHNPGFSLSATKVDNVSSNQPDTKDCQFCGERVKAVAIKCKHCGSNLAAEEKPTSSGQTPTWLSRIGTANNRSLMLCFGAIIIGILLTAAILVFRATLTATSSSTIYGAAWLTKANGQSDLLRGLEVSICDPGAGDVMDSEKVKLNKSLYDLSSSHGLTRNYDAGTPLINAITNEVAPHIIKSVRADADGKYTIDDISLGGVYVYERFVDATDGAIWLIPAGLHEGENLTLDLDNHNAKILVRR